MSNTHPTNKQTGKDCSMSDRGFEFFFLRMELPLTFVSTYFLGA